VRHIVVHFGGVQALRVRSVELVGRGRVQGAFRKLKNRTLALLSPIR
jgi:hypothetical protein